MTIYICQSREGSEFAAGGDACPRAQRREISKAEVAVDPRGNENSNLLHREFYGTCRRLEGKVAVALVTELRECRKVNGDRGVGFRTPQIFAETIHRAIRLPRVFRRFLSNTAAENRAVVQLKLRNEGAGRKFSAKAYEELFFEGPRELVLARGLIIGLEKE